MRFRLLASAVALAPLAGLAFAGDQTPDATTSAIKAESFDALDTNHDGRISMPEASADPQLVESFSTADKNGDGYLDAAEYSNAASREER
jgi:Ca2+-binding EF-hand superfamily protein